MDRKLGWSVVLLSAALMILTSGISSLPAREPDGGRPGKILKIRIYERGSETPNVLVNVPMSVVSAFVKLASRSGAVDAGLKEEGLQIGGKEGVRIRGADLEQLWEEIQKMEPGPIVEIQGDGDRVEIRIE